MGYWKALNPKTGEYEPLVGPVIDNYLQTLPAVKVKRIATQSIANGTPTIGSFDQVVYDPHGYWSSGSPTRLTIPPGRGGLYLAGATALINFTSGITTSNFQGKFLVNGTIYPDGARSHQSTAPILSTGAHDRTANPLTQVWLDDGDYIEAEWTQSNSASATMNIFGNASSSVPNSANQVFWLIKLDGVPGAPGPTGGSQIPFGSTFPGSPSTYERFFRTDIRGGMEFFWNGTYWLSSQVFLTSPNNRVSTTAITVNNYLNTHWYPQDVDDVFVVARIHSAFVSTTNNGSNYWNLRHYRIPTTGIETDSNTSTDGVGNWTEHRTDVNAITTDRGWHSRVEKVGSPGGLDYVGYAEYRIRAT